MNQPLTGKISLITGSSKGIGRAIALHLADLGAHVILVSRNEKALAELAGIITNQGGQASIMELDLENPSAIEQLAEQVRLKFQQLDILINNAGVAVNSSIEETSNADWDRCMATNARGAFILIRQCLPLLEQSNPGYIINISSVVGVKGYAQQIAYTASKHALRGMSIALAEELRERNVRVHVLCPGGVSTDMVKNMRPDIDEKALIHPEEIAELVAYLVTHQGNGIVDEIHIRRQNATPWFY